MEELTIREATVDDHQRCLEVERAVWAPFNWESEDAVGCGYHPELHLVAEDKGEIVASADAQPMRWDGNPENLPEGGWTELMLAAAAGFDEQPDWAFATGTSILPEYQGSGLAGQLLEGLRDRAIELGYRGLVAPVRPSARWRALHLDIADYAELRLPDGRHYDPWVRVHERIGGEIIGSCPDSAIFSAPREDWERWAAMKLPDNGFFLIDGAIGWLSLKEGHGVLSEDSLWLLHRP